MIRRFLCWLGLHDYEDITTSLLDKRGNPVGDSIVYMECRRCLHSSYL